MLLFIFYIFSRFKFIARVLPAVTIFLAEFKDLNDGILTKGLVLVDERVF